MLPLEPRELEVPGAIHLLTEMVYRIPPLPHNLLTEIAVRAG